MKKLYQLENSNHCLEYDFEDSNFETFEDTKHQVVMIVPDELKKLFSAINFNWKDELKIDIDDVLFSACLMFHPIEYISPEHILIGGN